MIRLPGNPPAWIRRDDIVSVVAAPILRHCPNPDAWGIFVKHRGDNTPYMLGGELGDDGVPQGLSKIDAIAQALDLVETINRGDSLK